MPNRLDPLLKAGLFVGPDVDPSYLQRSKLFARVIRRRHYLIATKYPKAYVLLNYSVKSGVLRLTRSFIYDHTICVSSGGSDKTAVATLS